MLGYWYLLISSQRILLDSYFLLLGNGNILLESTFSLNLSKKPAPLSWRTP